MGASRDKSRVVDKMLPMEGMTTMRVTVRLFKDCRRIVGVTKVNVERVLTL